MKFTRIICAVSVALTVASCAEVVYTTEATDNALITKDPYHYDIVLIKENAEYNIIKSLGAGLVLVDNGKEENELRVGCVNYDGELVIPFDYLEIGSLNDNLSLVKDVNGEYKYIDKENNIIIDSINGNKILKGTDFIDGYAVVNLKGVEGTTIIDTHGSELVSSEENYIYEYAGNHMFNVLGNDENSFVKVIDSEGNKIEQLENKIYTYTGNNLGYYQDENSGLLGIMNLKDYSKITECVILKGTNFENNTALVTSVENELLIIDPSAEVLENLSVTYAGLNISEVKGFNQGIGILNFDNDKGSTVINNLGKLLLETEYISISEVYENIAVIESVDGKFGYMNVTGEELLETNFDKATDIYEGKGLLSIDDSVYQFTVAKQSRGNN